MKKGIVGKKIGMTQIFTEDGRLIPVTVIEAGPCPVVQKKTAENDGYEAIQVGFDAYAENRAEKLVNKPLKGHFAKAGVAPTRRLRELRLEDCSAYRQILNHWTTREVLWCSCVILLLLSLFLL